jgi:twitching motility protein PilT
MTAGLASARLDEVLRVARLRGASDVHLHAGVQPVFRIDGILEPQESPAPDAGEMQNLTQGLLDPSAIETYSREGDVTVTYADSASGAMRVHAYRTLDGPSLAIRLLATSVPTLDALQLPAAVQTMASRPNGLFIFAGPTGSGKSTALAAMVEYINRTRACHILTIEDPIEYRHCGRRAMVTQREVGRDVPGFAAGVYGALRSDPDVILLGEMRDASTMHAALTAAETGHFVMTTLHTGDSAQTIDRMIGTFQGEVQDQARLQLAQTLVGVVCMRLVAKAASPGRHSAVEILIANDAVRNVVRDGKTHQLRNVIATHRHMGMQTLEQHLSELVSRGDVSLDAARAVTERPHEVRAASSAA